MRLAFITAALTFALTGCRTPEPQAAFAVVPRNDATAQFIGDWYVEGEAAPLYEISRSADGTTIIKTPVPETWSATLDNLRFEGQTLRFDSYYYTSPRKELRTIVNPYGAHPFSGVPCDTALEIDSKDTNRMVVTMKTPHITNEIRDVLFRREAQH